MHQLRPDQYGLARPLYAGMLDVHVSIAAVLAGTARGLVWVDDLNAPRVAFAATPEGFYLTGDPDCVSAYPGLMATIPAYAYLISQPPAWAERRASIWSNRVAREHPRLHLRLKEFRLRDYRARLPAGYELARVDADFLQRTELVNFSQVSERVASWPSREAFLEDGFGFCIVSGGAVVSRCIADNVVGGQCEMGVGTDPAHRQRGLGSIVVAAAVDDCLGRGLADIGWHCLANNRGSVGVAKKVGFEVDAAYTALSAVLPTENPGDMTPAECADWAQHYEAFYQDWLPYLAFAASAWAMIGEGERALADLERLATLGWQGDIYAFNEPWKFASVQGDARFQRLVKRLQEG